MDKIAYTPGRLAQKLGVSKGKLMNHLRETVLISADEQGHNCCRFSFR